jgi:ABC-type branched-subunit amino acid transport system substrate-binding protein
MNTQKVRFRGHKFALVLIGLVLILRATSHAEEPKTFDVGLALPLTGEAADYGIAIRNCIELAQSDKPDRFTHIRFHYEDAGYDPKLALTALHKLVDADHVDLAVTWGVSFCKALAPVAESRKIPLVGLCIDPTAAANKHFVLRFILLSAHLARFISELPLS